MSDVVQDSSQSHRTSALGAGSGLIRVLLNGETRDFHDGITVHDIVIELGLAQRRIAVEVNRDILPRAAYEQHRLCEGDVVEIVHFIGGG
jgi:sulfur carrier protein